MAAQLICNQWVAGSTPVTSSKKDPTIYRQNDDVYRGIFAFVCVVKCPESATKVRQIQEKPVLCDSVRPCSVCLALYHTAV